MTGSRAVAFVAIILAVLAASLFVWAATIDRDDPSGSTPARTTVVAP